MTDEELEQLLPWYVNDTLAPEEKAAVEALLERSESARAEVAFLQSLASQIKQDELAAPSEMGWRRLQRDIRRDKPSLTERWWRPGIAAAAAVVIAMQVMIVTQQPEPYDAQLLGEEPAQQLQQNDWLLQLQFDMDTPWSDIVETIRQLDGELVDGPSGIGLVRVRVPREQTRFSDADQLLEWLQQQSGVSHAAIETR